MREYVEFRINREYAHLLFREDEGVNLGSFVKKVNIAPTDPKFMEVGRLQEMLKEQTSRQACTRNLHQERAEESEINPL